MNQNSKTVRICTISDTHNRHNSIKSKILPEADIFIHAGDFTTHSTKKQLEDFRNFLKSLPYKHKIVISGNHDIVYDKIRYQ